MGTGGSQEKVQKSLLSQVREFGPHLVDRRAIKALDRGVTSEGELDVHGFTRMDNRRRDWRQMESGGIRVEAAVDLIVKEVEGMEKSG